MTGPRHQWSPGHRTSHHKTERTCARCGLFKVTRHEFAGSAGERNWTEWWRPVADGGPPERLDIDKTPACEPATEGDAP